MTKAPPVGPREALGFAGGTPGASARWEKRIQGYVKHLDNAPFERGVSRERFLDAIRAADPHALARIPALVPYLNYAEWADGPLDSLERWFLLARARIQGVTDAEITLRNLLAGALGHLGHPLEPEDAPGVALVGRGVTDLHAGRVSDGLIDPICAFLARLTGVEGPRLTRPALFSVCATRFPGREYQSQAFGAFGEVGDASLVAVPDPWLTILRSRWYSAGIFAAPVDWDPWFVAEFGPLLDAQFACPDPRGDGDRLSGRRVMPIHLAYPRANIHGAHTRGADIPLLWLSGIHPALIAAGYGISVLEVLEQVAALVRRWLQTGKKHGAAKFPDAGPVFYASRSAPFWILPPEFFVPEIVKTKRR